MHVNEKIIAILNAGEWQTSASIGLQAGLEEAKVQSQIQGLMDNGLLLEESAYGYRLNNQIHLLDANEIAGFLHPNIPLDSFEVFQSIKSTNSHLLAKPIQDGRLRVCVSEAQLDGRGRRGNTWLSTPYRNIMLSISWGFEKWPDTIGALGLAAALCITEELNKLYSLDIKIKWPNDLLANDDKVAGILIDVAGESAGQCKVVIGLGLNVSQVDWSKGNSEGYRWQDLCALGVKANRNQLVAKLINAQVDMLKEFELSGFESLTERWNKLNSFASRQVRVGSGENYVAGQMVGVDKSGALLVDALGGVRHLINDSNLSVRLVET